MTSRAGLVRVAEPIKVWPGKSINTRSHECSEATGPGGIWVISPSGEHLGTILVPENTGNMTWGSEDWHTLFIPSSTSLYTIRTTVGPRREPYMR